MPAVNTTTGLRAPPDVSINADPNTGAIIIVKGAPASIKDPTASAISATPPTPYVGGFHDVLTGSNGAYSALPRYDFTTGLGTSDIDRVNAEL